MILGTSGQRNYTPLLRQLIEQERRSLTREVRTANPASDKETIASISDPKIISDDEKSSTTTRWTEVVAGRS